METTIVYWRYVGKMENKVETTIVSQPLYAGSVQSPWAHILLSHAGVCGRWKISAMSPWIKLGTFET